MIAVAVKCWGERGFEVFTVPVAPVTEYEKNQAILVNLILDDVMIPFGEFGDRKVGNTIRGARLN